MRLSGPASAPKRKTSRRRKSDPSDSDHSAERGAASPSMGSSGQSSNTPSALGSGSAGAPTVSVGPVDKGAPLAGAPASAPASPEFGPGLDFGGLSDSPANISHGDSFHLATMSARDSLRGEKAERGILGGSMASSQPSDRVQTGPSTAPAAAPRINFQAQVSRGMRDHGMAAVRAVHGDIDFGVATEEELAAPPTPHRARSSSTHGILGHRHRGRSKSKPSGPSRKGEGRVEGKPLPPRVSKVDLGGREARLVPPLALGGIRSLGGPCPLRQLRRLGPHVRFGTPLGPGDSPHPIMTQSASRQHGLPCVACPG